MCRLSAQVESFHPMTMIESAATKRTVSDCSSLRPPVMAGCIKVKVLARSGRY